MNGALAVMLGLAYVVSPGPVNVETPRRGLAGGFQVALALIVGHLAWAILALAGAGLLLTHAAAQTLLGIAGTALLPVFQLESESRLCQSVRTGTGAALIHFRWANG